MKNPYVVQHPETGERLEEVEQMIWDLVEPCFHRFHRELLEAALFGGERGQVSTREEMEARMKAVVLRWQDRLSEEW